MHRPCQCPVNIVMHERAFLAHKSLYSATPVSVRFSGPFWRTKVIVFCHPSRHRFFVFKHRDLDAEGGVRSWTDFLKAELAPASVRLLPGLWQGAAGFSGFGAGAGALASDEQREGALDSVRLLAEECDHLQVRPRGLSHARCAGACIPSLLVRASFIHWLESYP